MANKIARVCWVPLCGRINCTIHGPRPISTRPPDTRPSAARRGYGARWQHFRKKFLAAHPDCEDCGAPATDVDHVPSRRELNRRGVPNPDADQYLHARCHPHHSKKTALEDGGWGRGSKKSATFSC